MDQRTRHPRKDLQTWCVRLTSLSKYLHLYSIEVVVYTVVISDSNEVSFGLAGMPTLRDYQSDEVEFAAVGMAPIIVNKALRRRLLAAGSRLCTIPFLLNVAHVVEEIRKDDTGARKPYDIVTEEWRVRVCLFHFKYFVL